ncbi:MAG: hypothetical protein M3Y27_04640 [Acidobacteriota bacterium]|nr:hypothetical protein [Acidobacteriota bacterium]
MRASFFRNATRLHLDCPTIFLREAVLRDDSGESPVATRELGRRRAIELLQSGPRLLPRRLEIEARLQHG